MKSEMEEMVYETPLVKMIEVEVENGFAQSFGDSLENPSEDDYIDW